MRWYRIMTEKNTPHDCGILDTSGYVKLVICPFQVHAMLEDEHSWK